MHKLLFLSFILFTFVASSQQGAYAYRPRGFRKYEPSARIAIGVSPLALLDFYNGASYKGGISFKPVKILRFTADFGSYWPQLTKIITPWNDIQGYNFRASAGLYLSYTGDISFGFEYQYKTQSFNYTDSVPNQPSFVGNVNKLVHVFNLYVSYDWDLTRRVYVELRFNFGVRYRDITNDQSAQLENSVNWHDSLNQWRITQGKNFLANVNFAVRLNYVIWPE